MTARRHLPRSARFSINTGDDKAGVRALREAKRDPAEYREKVVAFRAYLDAKKAGVLAPFVKVGGER
jgi:hypothetical protein